jgi:hypothetical protein
MYSKPSQTVQNAIMEIFHERVLNSRLQESQTVLLSCDSKLEVNENMVPSKACTICSSQLFVLCGICEDDSQLCEKCTQENINKMKKVVLMLPIENLNKIINK